jgi:hypothetical protein
MGVGNAPRIALSLKTKDCKDKAGRNNRVVRPGEGHAPGIPHEPLGTLRYCEDQPRLPQERPREFYHFKIGGDALRKQPPLGGKELSLEIYRSVLRFYTPLLEQRFLNKNSPAASPWGPPTSRASMSQHLRNMPSKRSLGRLISHVQEV